MVAWSSFFTHLIYGGIAACTTGFHISDISPMHVSFSILLLRSILGMINAIEEEGNENVKKAFDFMDQVTIFFAFPFYAAHLWLGHGVRMELAYLHPLVALIPFGLYMAEKDFEDASSAVLLGNAISAAYVTIVSNNWYGLAATGVFAISHGVIKLEENDTLSKEDTFNVLLAVFMVMVWFSLGGHF